MTKISSFNQYVGTKMNSTAKGVFAKALEKGFQHPAEYAAKMMVVSLISKDAINCAFYTYQSLHNEKIPEDKRGFVAALDFVNGIINVGGQIAAFALVDKYLTPWLEGKLYTGVLKNPKTGTEKFMSSTRPLSPDVIYQDTLQVLKEQKTNLTDALKKDTKKLNYESLEKNAKKITDDIVKKIGHSGLKGKDIATGVKIVVTALATTALIKRTLTPLIATPLAGVLNDKYNPPKKSEDKTQKMIEANYKPWLTKAPDNKNDLNPDKFEKPAQKQV